MLSLALALFIACGGAPAAPATPPEVAVAPPPAQVHPKPSPEVLAEGKRVYEAYCQACHQADGTGMNGMLGANFKADKTRLAKDDATLIESITKGKTGTIGVMPPWGETLTSEEVTAVLGYLRDTYGD